MKYSQTNIYAAIPNKHCILRYLLLSFFINSITQTILQAETIHTPTTNWSTNKVF